MPTKRLHVKYSKFELDNMKKIGLFAINNILTTMPNDTKESHVKSLGALELISRDPGNIDSLYEGKYQDLKEALNGAGTNEITEKKSDPNYYNKALDDKGGTTFYADEAYEPVIADMVKSLGEISKALDTYIQQMKSYDAELIEDDILKDTRLRFVSFIKKMIDDLAKGAYFQMNLLENPPYLHAWNTFDSILDFEKSMLIVNFPDENHPSHTIKQEKSGGNWEDIVSKFNGFSVLNAVIEADSINQKLQKYNKTGEIDRSELLEEYRSYQDTIDTFSDMSEDAYNDLNVSGDILISYEDMRVADSTAKLAYYDTKARVMLLDAGYSLKDTEILAQVYSIMQEAQAYIQNENNPNAGSVRFVYENLSIQWDKIINDIPVTEEKRKENLESLLSNFRVFLHKDDAKEFDHTPFQGGRGFNRLRYTLEDRMGQGLTPLEKMLYTDSMEAVYDALCSVDKKKVSSSPAFNEMKLALEKLKDCDRYNEQERFEQLKEDAIDKIKAYLDYKDTQLNNPGKPYKRSEYEAKRVIMANEILNRLENRYEFKEPVSYKALRDSYNKQLTIEDKFYHYLTYRAGIFIGPDSKRVDMTDEEREAAGIPVTGNITEYQKNNLKKIEKKLLKDLNEHAFGTTKDIRSIRDIKKIFDVIGSMNAKVAVQAGKKYDEVYHKVTPEQDKKFLDFKIACLMVSAQGQNGVMYNNLQDFSNVLVGNLLEENMDIYMMDYLKEAYKNNVNAKNMLIDLGITDPDMQAKFLGVDPNAGLKDIMRNAVIEEYGQLSEGEIEEKAIDELRPLTKQIRDLWVMQSENSIKKTLNDFDKRYFEYGKKAINAEYDKKVKKEVEENQAYKAWAEDEGKEIAVEMTKAEYHTAFTELMDSSKTQKRHGVSYQVLNREEILSMKKAASVYHAGIRDMISILQSDADAFIDTQEDKHHLGADGSDEYRAMTSKLIQVFKVLGDDGKKPSEIKKALNDYTKAAQNFKETRLGLFDTGLTNERIDIINRTLQHVSDMLPFYDNMRYPLTNDHIRTRNMSIEAIEEKLEKHMKYAEISENEIRMDENACEEAISSNKEKVKAQKKLMKKLAPLTSHHIKLDVTISNPDDIVPSRKSPTADKLATDYMITHYIEIMNDPNYDANDINTLYDHINDGGLKGEAKALANNPVFKAVALSHPDTYYSEWNRVMTKASFMQKKKELLVSNFNNYGKNAVLNDIMGMTNDENRYEYLAEKITHQILADPKNEKICQAVVAGQFKESDIQKKIKENLTEKGILSVPEGQEPQEKTNALRAKISETVDQMKNGALKDRCVRDAVSKMKPKSLEVKKKAPERNQQAIGR